MSKLPCRKTSLHWYEFACQSKLFGPLKPCSLIVKSRFAIVFCFCKTVDQEDLLVKNSTGLNACWSPVLLLLHQGIFTALVPWYSIAFTQCSKSICYLITKSVLHQGFSMTCLFSCRSSFQEPSAQRVSVCRQGDGKRPETESQPWPKSRWTATFSSHQPLTDRRRLHPHRRRGRGSEEGLSFGEGIVFEHHLLVKAEFVGSFGCLMDVMWFKSNC